MVENMNQTIACLVDLLNEYSESDWFSYKKQTNVFEIYFFSRKISIINQDTKMNSEEIREKVLQDIMKFRHELIKGYNKLGEKICHTMSC